MTWEQEMKYQARILAEDMAQDMATDIAQDLAKNLAENIAEEKNIETAQKFLEMGISPEQVSKGTDIPLEKVLELQEKTKC